MTFIPLFIGMLIGVVIGFRAGRQYERPVEHESVLCDPVINTPALPARNSL